MITINSMSLLDKSILEILKKNTTLNLIQHHKILLFMMFLILLILQKIQIKKFKITMGLQMNSLRKLLIMFASKKKIKTKDTVLKIKSSGFIKAKNKKQLLDWLLIIMGNHWFNYWYKIIKKEEFQELIIKYLMNRQFNQL